MPRAALLLLVLVLAGCFGGSPNDSGGQSSSSSSSSTNSSSNTSSGPGEPTSQPSIALLLDFDFAPCRGIRFQASQGVADVQALLPAGFTVFLTTIVPGQTTGVLGVDMYACGNLTTPFSNVPNTFYGQVYTRVQPPTSIVEPALTADVHEYVFRVLANEDILNVLWRAAGYDTYNGTFTVSTGAPIALPADPGIRVGQAEVTPGYFVSATGHPDPRPVTPTKQTFARYTILADNSTLVWTGRYDFTGAIDGEGRQEVPATDPFSRFVGPLGALHGTTRVHQTGGMYDMDLRRFYKLPS